MYTLRLARVAGRRALLARRAFSSFPEHTVHTMPALSPTMEAGNIAKWNLDEGAEFATGDVIAEIETDKATVDYEAVDDGVLARILMPAGSSDVAVAAAPARRRGARAA